MKNMKIVTREVFQGELDKIANLEKECFNSNHFTLTMIEEMYLNKRYKILGAFVEGKIQGYLITYDTSDVYEIIKVGTSKENRGLGIGSYIIEKSFSKMDRSLMLEVRESNENAINLYEKLGFQKIGKRKGYYQDTKEDALIYIIEK